MIAAVFLGLKISKASSWTKTSGTIVATESCGTTRECTEDSNGRRTCRDRTTYKAVIEFDVCEDVEVEVCDDGCRTKIATECRTYTVRPNSCSDPPPKVGNQIAVLYEPDNPEKAIDGSFFGLWGVPTILGGLGLLFLLFSLPCMEKYYVKNSTPHHNRRDGHHHNSSHDFGGGGEGDGGGDCGGGGGDCGGE